MPSPRPCWQPDFVTIHPRSPETGLIGERELALVKEGARLVNTSRGGIVDETALIKALEDGRVAGAALDVFEHEPPSDSPLFRFDQVVTTPHLGASTAEAQDKAGTSVAEMVRLALNGEFVPYAVNVSAARCPSSSARSSPLAERLGSAAHRSVRRSGSTVQAQYLGRSARRIRGCSRSPS
jgi:D-3-phosphoglycerate dehydrogenase